MKKTLTIIWKFINSKVFGYITIGIVALILLGTCNRNINLKQEATRTEQNISVLTDSVNSEQLKNGKLQVSIGGYIANAEELEQYNSELAAEVKAQKGQVITLNRIVFRLHNDSTSLANKIDSLTTILHAPIRENDSTWTVPWEAGYKNIGIIKGQSTVGVNVFNENWLKDINLTNEGILITDINIPVEMVWGQKWEGTGKNKKLKIYAKTSYPGFDTKLLEGTYADMPEKRHWFTGFGIGPQLGVGYDFLNNQPAITIGVGISYNVYQW